MMETVKNSGGAVPKTQGSSRDNNLTMIRIVATLFVFAGHMGVLLGGEPPFLGGFGLHEIGVDLLFLMSGYLITKSWLSDPDPLRFAVRRFFRLWPPFAVMVLIMVFVTGPLVSELGVRGYFESWYTVYLRNLRFFIVYAQPGVFEHLPVAYATNGSLRTMPIEAALYVVTPILLTALRVKGRSKTSFYLTAVLTGAVCISDVLLRAFWPDAQVIFYGVEWVSAYHLIVLYVIGIFFTYKEVQKYLNVQVGCAVMCLLFIFQLTSVPLRCLLMYITLPYFVFSLAFASKPVFSGLGRRLEPSYGIYLYGFFFQQLVIYLQLKNGISLGYTKSLLLSLVPTLAAAVLSYYLVEKPALRLSRFLIRKLKARTSGICH